MDPAGSVTQRKGHMRLDHPQAGKLQQGAIFNCAAISGYENCKCSGVVMTARCDLEHGKQSVINYLPVVPFSAWAQRSLSAILARRLRNEIDKDITNQLTKKGITDTLRATFPLRDIISHETTGAEKKGLLEKLDQLQVVDQELVLAGNFSPNARRIFNLAGKRCDRLIDELIQQKLGEFYFLDAVDLYERDGEGNVVLLRQMCSMDCLVADRIVVGLQPEESADLPDINRNLTFAHEPICMVTGVLRSPDIEHLTQQYSKLFSRIGLEDHQKSTFDQHYAILKSI